MRPYDRVLQDIWCGACHNCIFPGPFQHEFFAWGSWYPERAGGNHSCILSPCDHPPCGLGLRLGPDSARVLTAQTWHDRDAGEADRAFSAVAARVQRGDLAAVDAIVRLVVAYPDRVSLNRQRGALQLQAACGLGVVAGHLPLTTRVVEQVGRQIGWLAPLSVAGR